MPDNNTASQSRHFRFITITLVVIAIVACIWWLRQRSTDEQDANRRKGGLPTAVSVARAQQQDVPLEISALGTVTSSYTVTVRSRVDGQLEKLHFKEGDLVKQGQLLAELDARPYQAALAQAQGQLLRDQALLKNAELDLKRYKQLQEQNSIAEQEVETQQALVHQYEGTVKVDQGQVDNAKLQLEYSRITAPVSGRAGLRQVDPGNIVHSSDTTGVVVITQTQPVNLVFAIPETSLTPLLEAMKQGANNQAPTLKVEAWSRDNREKIADGELLALDNQLNASTGTVNVKARFANDRQQLFPNQFINARLQLGTHTNAITVPTAAIQIGKPGNFVYTVNADQTVSITKVRTGIASRDATVIEEGLHAGQTVVIDGLDKLRDGATVKVIDKTAPDNPAADQPAGQHKREHKDKAGANNKDNKPA